MRTDWMAVAAALLLGACAADPMARSEPNRRMRESTSPTRARTRSPSSTPTRSRCSPPSTRAATPPTTSRSPGTAGGCSPPASPRAACPPSIPTAGDGRLHLHRRSRPRRRADERQQPGLGREHRRQHGLGRRRPAYRILGTIPTGEGPTGLTFSRDGRFAYVSHQGDKTVEVVDTATHKILKVIPVEHRSPLSRAGAGWSDPGREHRRHRHLRDRSDHPGPGGATEVGPAPQQIAFGFKGIAGAECLRHRRRAEQGRRGEHGPARPADPRADRRGQRPNGIWANNRGTRPSPSTKDRTT